MNAFWSRSKLRAAAALFVAAGCGGGDAGPSAPDPPRATSISIGASSFVLNYIGQTRILEARVLDQNGRSMSAQIAWSSSDSLVVRSEGGGRVTAVSPGAAAITASAEGLAASVQARVTQQPASMRVVSGNDQRGGPNEELPEPLVVEVRDRGNHGIAGIAVEFAPATGDGSVQEARVSADSSGRASTSWTLGDHYGSHDLIAKTSLGVQTSFSAWAESEYPLADLKVANLAILAPVVTELDSVDIALSFLNQGDATSPKTQVDFAVNGGTVSSDSAPALEPLDSAVARFRLGPLSTGRSTIAATLNPGGAFEEHRLDNNSSEAAVEVVPQQALSPGAQLTIEGDEGDLLRYRIRIDEGFREALVIDLDGGDGDADLYVHYGTRPAHYHYSSCLSTTPTADERCRMTPARAGDYDVVVHAFSDFTPAKLSISRGGASADPFDLEVVFVNHGTPEQDKVVLDAAKRWEEIIAEGVQDIDFSDSPTPADRCGRGSPSVSDVVDDVRVFVRIDSIDGRGNILAQAGPCYSRIFPSDEVGDVPRSSILGSIELDEDDLDAIAERGLLIATVTHEMGHVLGIGSSWRRYGLLEDPSIDGPAGADPHFTGPLARAAFDALGGSGYQGVKVPVEGKGVRGRSDSHWRESVFGSELMSPLIGSAVEPLSLITIESLADMGYQVRTWEADRYRIPSARALAETPREDERIDLGGDVVDRPLYLVDPKGRVVRILTPPAR